MAGKIRYGVAVWCFIAVAFPALLFAADQGSMQEQPKEPADMAAFLNSLGKKVSDFTSLKTEFIQEKKMAMFKDKLVMKGRIFLQKPNKLAWHVDSPVRYSVLITDKLIRQWDEDTNKVQEISLAKNPLFQNVLNQLTVWFSGDYSSLLAVNEVRLLRNDPLEIEFVPREKNVAKKVIKSITITFREDRNYLKQIRIQELSGDLTTITFINTLLNVPLDNASFEVNPVREHSSRTIMEGDALRLSLENAAGRRHGQRVFSNGVKVHA
jgi:outer membrane lipoprotein-sorting protein